MRKKIFDTKYKFLLLCIMIFSMAITLLSFSNNQRISPKIRKNINLRITDFRKSNKENAKDSSVIAILSPDGKLVREFKYQIENVKKNNPNGMPKYVSYIKGYPTSDTIIGDFNGDGKMEKAWFKDKGFNAFEDCQNSENKKSCEGIIQFSDTNIRQLVIDHCPIWTFKNEGDLYGDGKDEIGVLPGWFSSNCREYLVFSFKNNEWFLICDPIGNTYNMREAGIVLIEKDKNRKGYAIVRESVDNYISSNPKHKIPSEYTTGSCCQWSNIVEHSIKLK